MKSDTEFVRESRSQAAAAHRVRLIPGGLEKWIGRVVKTGFEQRTGSHVNKEWMFVEVQAVRDGRLGG